MNFRDELEELHNVDSVRIKSCGAIFRNLHNDSRVKLSKNITDNIVDKNIDLRKESGKIIKIFKHPGLKSRPNVYVVRIDTLKVKNKYILIGKTGIKKLGPVTIKVSE